MRGGFAAARQRIDHRDLERPGRLHVGVGQLEGQPRIAFEQKDVIEREEFDLPGYGTMVSSTPGTRAKYWASY